MKKLWKDKLIMAGFWSTLIYSITYPTIHLWIMKELNESLISFNSILSCVSIIIFSILWNKYSRKLYGVYPFLMVCEIILYAILHIFVILGKCNASNYYIFDILITSTIMRNVVCGGNKLRSILYTGEKREKYDNSMNIATSTGTLIGSSIAMFSKIPISIIFIISWVGLSIDDVFYIVAYYETKKLNIKKKDDDEKW